MNTNTINRLTSPIAISKTSYNSETKEGYLTLTNGKKYKLTFKNINESKLQENFEKVAQNVVSMLQTKGLLLERSFNQATINSKGIKTPSSFFNHDDASTTRTFYQRFVSAVTNTLCSNVTNIEPSSNPHHKDQPQASSSQSTDASTAPLVLNSQEDNFLTNFPKSSTSPTDSSVEETKSFNLSNRKIDLLKIKKILLVALPVLTMIGTLIYTSTLLTQSEPVTSENSTIPSTEEPIYPYPLLLPPAPTPSLKPTITLPTQPFCPLNGSLSSLPQKPFDHNPTFCPANSSLPSSTEEVCYVFNVKEAINSLVQLFTSYLQ